MILCIWYPSGGFGHFVNAVMTKFSHKFVRPADTDFVFGPRGDSHNLSLVAPKYRNTQEYNFEFDNNLNYTVLIDNGINDEGDRFKTQFPGAQILKICYTDHTWPIVAKTMIVKAMNQDFSSQVQVDSDGWNCQEPWAIREKYFLYLRDHHLRYSWRPDQHEHLTIDQMLDYKELSHKLKSMVPDISEFGWFYDQWREKNQEYIDPVIQGHQIVSQLMTKNYQPIDHITDLWTQAVINYHIWLQFNYEIPANDYGNWFQHSEQIGKLL